jgi:hypothetical protein
MTNSNSKLSQIPALHVIAMNAERIRSLATIGAHLLDTFSDEGPTKGDIAVLFELIESLSTDIDLAGAELSKLNRSNK